MLIAVAIGVHNFSEGLAIACRRARRARSALAATLVVGFALHNATEGFGIVGPLRRRATRAERGWIGLVGIVGGVPAFVGTRASATRISALVCSSLALPRPGGRRDPLRRRRALGVGREARCRDEERHPRQARAGSWLRTRAISSSCTREPERPRSRRGGARGGRAGRALIHGRSLVLERPLGSQKIHGGGVVRAAQDLEALRRGDRAPGPAWPSAASAPRAGAAGAAPRRAPISCS